MATRTIDAKIGWGRLNNKLEKYKITINIIKALTAPESGVFALLSSFSRLLDMLAPTVNP